MGVPRKEGDNNWIKEMCNQSTINKSKCYDVCRPSKYTQLMPFPPVPPPTFKGGLSPEQMDRIMKLADDPSRSFTVPDMCDEMARKYLWKILRKAVYRHLPLTLGYSYLPNHFKPATLFQSGQEAVNFLVCKAILDFNMDGRNLRCINGAPLPPAVLTTYCYTQ